MTRAAGARASLPRALVALIVVAGLAGCAASLAGCGRSRHTAGDRIAGPTLTVYSSLPLQGASAVAARTVLWGERLALAQSRGRIGHYAIALRSLDDATPQRRGWDPGQTSIDAHLAAQDPSAVGYIGEFNSGASAIAIPPLNRVGIPEISPTSTAVGLTSTGPGAAPGEPAKYYPSGRRTFVRLAPDDALEAIAQVRLQLGMGCRATYVLFDNGEFDGYDAAAAFQPLATARGLKVLAAQGYDPGATDYTSLARAVARSGADCVLVSALPQSHAALLTAQIGSAMPTARIFAISALAQSSFTDPREGGIPLDLDQRVLITAPAWGAGPGAAAFAQAYGRRFGSPGPFAAYGYESMRLLLSAISRATHGGRDAAERSRVLKALLASRVGDGALGGFAVAPDGSTSLHQIAVYRLADGQLSLWTSMSVVTRPSPVSG